MSVRTPSDEIALFDVVACGWTVGLSAPVGTDRLLERPIGSTRIRRQVLLLGTSPGPCRCLEHHAHDHGVYSRHTCDHVAHAFLEQRPLQDELGGITKRAGDELLDDGLHCDIRSDLE